MTTHRMVWRLDGLTIDMPIDLERLTAGLALHLTRADLLTIVMRIGAQTRAYLALDGCGGCERGRCEIGCYADLFSRMLTHSTGGAAILHHVPGGLATRVYPRAVVATPTRRARALDTTLLTPWPEARLILHWRGARRTQGLGALLLVGRDGPDPAEALRAQGWRPWPRLSWVVRRGAQRAIPTQIAMRGRWTAPPFLLLPPSHVGDVPLPAKPDKPNDTASTMHDGLLDMLPRLTGATNGRYGANGTSTSTPDDAALAAWLRTAIDQARQSEDAVGSAPVAIAEAVPTAEAGLDNSATSWPSGPCGLRPATLKDVIFHLTTDAAFMSGTQVSQIGVVKGRLIKQLGLADEVAAALIVWLDAAGVLADPYRPEDRWRKPRQLILTDSAQIAQRLRATPLPDAAMVEAAYAAQK
jgi:hypothetical protein